MTTAGSIVVDLLMKTGSFETDSKRAEARAKAMAREIEKAGLIIGAAMGTAALATIAWTKASIDAADEAIKQAQSVGLLVEQYTALTYAGNLSGVAQQDMAGALTLLSRRAKDAADGSKEAAESFDRLGISVTTPAGALKATDQLLAELADRFAAMPDSAEKTAFATEILGRSGAKLIPLLNGGADGLRAMADEARELGVVIDTQTAKAAEQFNDNLTRLSELARGFGNDLAREMLPLLVETSEMLVAMGRDSRQGADGLSAATLVAQAFSTTLKGALIVLSNLQFILQGTGREIGAWAAQIGVALDILTTRPDKILSEVPGKLKGFRAISDAVREDAERARQEFDDLQVRILSLGRMGAAQIQRAATQPQDTIAPFTPGRAPGSGNAGADAAARRAAEQAAKQAKAQRDLEASLAAIVPGSAIAANSLLSFGEVVVDLGDDFFKARTPVEELADGFRQIERAALSMDLSPVAEQVQQVDERFQKLGDNIQDAIGTTLYQSLKGDFDNIFDLWADLLLRMLAEAAAADLARALGLGGQGGNLNALLGNLGSIFGLGPGRAGGGPVQRGKLHPVNEMGGPGELLNAGGRQYLLAGQNGSVTPLTSALPSFFNGRNGVQVNVNVETLPGETAQVSQRQNGNALDVMVRIVKQTVRDDIANKGPISRDLAGTFGLNRATGAPRRS